MYNPFIAIIVERAKWFMSKYYDVLMYLTFWHPNNHKMWFVYYRDIKTFDTRHMNIKEGLDLIDKEFNGNRWQKCDYILGIIRAFILLIGAMLLSFAIIRNAYINHLGIFSGKLF